MLAKSLLSQVSSKPKLSVCCLTWFHFIRRICRFCVCSVKKMCPGDYDGVFKGGF